MFTVVKTLTLELMFGPYQFSSRTCPSKRFGRDYVLRLDALSLAIAVLLGANNVRGPVPFSKLARLLEATNDAKVVKLESWIDSKMETLVHGGTNNPLR